MHFHFLPNLQVNLSYHDYSTAANANGGGIGQVYHQTASSVFQSHHLPQDSPPSSFPTGTISEEEVVVRSGGDNNSSSNSSSTQQRRVRDHSSSNSSSSNSSSSSSSNSSNSNSSGQIPRTTSSNTSNDNDHSPEGPNEHLIRQLGNILRSSWNEFSSIPIDLSIITTPLPTTRASVNSSSSGIISLQDVNQQTTAFVLEEETHSELLENECSICQVAFQNLDMIRQMNSCQHCYHMSCLDRWLQQSGTCPICRVQLSSSSNGSPPSTDLI